MKKLIIILLVILVGFYLLMASLDPNGQFVAEEKLWKLNKRFAQIAKDPKAVPESNFKGLVDDYKKFMERFKNSNLKPAAHLSLARVLAVKGEYENAREEFEKIITLYEGNSAVTIRAFMEIGNTYAREKKWDELANVYDSILREYPFSEIGLRIPLLKGNLFASIKKIGLARKSFEEAVNYYQQLIEEQPSPIIEIKSLTHLSNAYLALNQPKKAIETTGSILLNHPNLYPTVAHQLIKAMNTIALTRLGKLDLPIKIYQQFIEQNPNHPYNQSLKKVIEGLRAAEKKIEEFKKEKEAEAVTP